MLRLIIFLIALINVAEAKDLAIILHTTSHHYTETAPDRMPWNEANHGVGFYANGLSIGTYKNSWYTKSYYVGYERTYKANKWAKLNYGGALAFGYPHTPVLPMPYVGVEVKINERLSLQAMQLIYPVTTFVIKYHL